MAKKIFQGRSHRKYILKTTRPRVKNAPASMAFGSTQTPESQGHPETRNAKEVLCEEETDTSVSG